MPTTRFTRNQKLIFQGENGTLLQVDGQDKEISIYADGDDVVRDMIYDN